MVSSDSVHADTRIVCGATLTDDDGKELLNELGHPQSCGTDLRGDQHATYVKHPRGKDRNGTDLRHRFEQSALRWDCPNCGQQTWTCPVCGDEDGGPGYFRGDSTGDLLACHNCNAAEVARRDRGYRADGGQREADLPGIPTSLNDVPDGLPPQGKDRNGGR